MSDYCRDCRYDPKRRIDDAMGLGKPACPFTTLFWNFVEKNRDALVRNPRTMMMVKNLDRLDADERAALPRQAARVLEGLDEL